MSPALDRTMIAAGCARTPEPSYTHVSNPANRVTAVPLVRHHARKRSDHVKITLRRSLAALAVAAAVLASAGPVSAILYNGHAGLGASLYQHNQTDLE